MEVPSLLRNCYLLTTVQSWRLFQDRDSGGSNPIHPQDRLTNFCTRYISVTGLKLGDEREDDDSLEVV